MVASNSSRVIADSLSRFVAEIALRVVVDTAKLFVDTAKFVINTANLFVVEASFKSKNCFDLAKDNLRQFILLLVIFWVDPTLKIGFFYKINKI